MAYSRQAARLMEKGARAWRWTRLCPAKLEGNVPRETWVMRPIHLTEATGAEELVDEEWTPAEAGGSAGGRRERSSRMDGGDGLIGLLLLQIVPIIHDGRTCRSREMRSSR
jgi:hypothetical protein